MLCGPNRGRSSLALVQRTLVLPVIRGTTEIACSFSFALTFSFAPYHTFAFALATTRFTLGTIATIEAFATLTLAETFP